MVFLCISIREVEAGSLAGDSTGFSYMRFVRWFDVRADRFRPKKDGSNCTPSWRSAPGDNRLPGD